MRVPHQHTAMRIQPRKSVRADTLHSLPIAFQQMTMKIYLAGPDVFFRDANASYERLESLCLEHGFQGVRPSDGGLSSQAKGTVICGNDISQRIYDANMELLRSCDAVLANLMPFRGELEPDSGTVFEVGAAAAMGKFVAGYFPQCHEEYELRVARACGQLEPEANGDVFDSKYGFLIERFSQPLNLMLARSCRLFCQPEDALAHLRKLLLRH